MKWLLLLLGLLIAACATTPTAPALPDPTVLVTNQATDAPNYPGTGTVTLTWYDQSGKVTTNVIPPLTTQCVRFTATTVADSVRFLTSIGDSTLWTVGVGFSSTWSTWFYPGSNGQWTGGGAFWTALATGSTLYRLTVTPVAAAPC